MQAMHFILNMVLQGEPEHPTQPLYASMPFKIPLFQRRCPGVQADLALAWLPGRH